MTDEEFLNQLWNKTTLNRYFFCHHSILRLYSSHLGFAGIDFIHFWSLWTNLSILYAPYNIYFVLTPNDPTKTFLLRLLNSWTSEQLETIAKIKWQQNCKTWKPNFDNVELLWKLDTVKWEIGNGTIACRRLCQTVQQKHIQTSMENQEGQILEVRRLLAHKHRH